MVYREIPIHMKSIKKMPSTLFNLPFKSWNQDVLIFLYLMKINNAIKLRLVDLSQVLQIIQRKPPLMHLVLTGRDAHPDIIELADTVSEIHEIKHAYRRDIEPQPGIDY